MQLDSDTVLAGQNATNYTQSNVQDWPPKGTPFSITPSLSLEITEYGRRLHPSLQPYVLRALDGMYHDIAASGNPTDLLPTHEVHYRQNWLRLDFDSFPLPFEEWVTVDQACEIADFLHSKTLTYGPQEINGAVVLNARTKRKGIVSLWVNFLPPVNVAREQG
ncbi:MAG: hypothetical protein Q9181_001510 [Wetmoreana brouardii]